MHTGQLSRVFGAYPRFYKTYRRFYNTYRCFYNAGERFYKTYARYYKTYVRYYKADARYYNSHLRFYNAPSPTLRLLPVKGRAPHIRQQPGQKSDSALTDRAAYPPLLPVRNFRSVFHQRRPLFRKNSTKWKVLHMVKPRTPRNANEQRVNREPKRDRSKRKPLP